MMPPSTLDHHGIASRIPHQGTMCLLDQLEHWSPQTIHCSSMSHHAPDNPLRTASGLLSACAIEYAAQAMALHGALVATAGGPPRAGLLASVRAVRLNLPRLDLVAGALQVHAQRLGGDAGLVSYRFHVDDAAGACLVEGRATVVLDLPPPQPTDP